MRKGYRREYDPEKDEEYLFDPKGETIAFTKFLIDPKDKNISRNNYGNSPYYAVVKSYLIDIKIKEVLNRDELRQLLTELTDKHYMTSTTRWQKTKDRVWRISSNPVWGWLAFIITVAVDVIGGLK